MASRKGSLLEKNVEQLLKLSGLSPELNKIYNGYEIDVFLNYNNFRIAFECKQYERSTLAIRNLIHQWDSKNKELKFDRIILVLLGCDISPQDYQLAKKYGILIWDEPKLTNLLDSAIENKSENKKNILASLGITTDATKETEKKEIGIGQTEQQFIIKDALEVMLARGVRRSGFITFKEEGTNSVVQYTFLDKGFMLNACPLFRPLLTSLNFKEKRLGLHVSIAGQETPAL